MLLVLYFDGHFDELIRSELFMIGETR